MFVIDVIPLSRTAAPEPLSYRSTKKFSSGTIVTVPLRRKLVPAIVVASIPVQEARAELKSASFSLKKSTSQTHGRLPLAYVEAAKATALYHASTFGSVLASLLIPVLGDDGLRLKIVPSGGAASKKKIAGLVTIYEEAPVTERLKKYESQLSSKAPRESILILVPTEAEARTFCEYFKKWKPVVITGAVPEKRRESLFVKAYDSNTIVIVTPSFGWIPIKNLACVIVERVSAGGYILPKRPYIDVRVALKELAASRKVPLLYGDYPLPLEYRPKPESKLRGGTPENIQIIDVRTKSDSVGEEPKWQAVPESILERIRRVHEEGRAVAVLATRRGYAPVVVCRDCGTTVTDAYGRSLSLVTEKSIPLLRSADGISIESAKTLCKECRSWNLIPLGVGSERVEEALRHAFPKASIIRIDQDTSSAKLRKVAKVAQEEPGTIFVGTELMLPWLDPLKQIDLAVIASADSLLALPFWRARERFVRMALILAKQSKSLLIATRRPEDATFWALENLLPSNAEISGSISRASFWKEETRLRKILRYPPFGTLIVFHIEGNATTIEKLESLLIATCMPYTLQILPVRQLSASKLRSTSVLQLDGGIWPNALFSKKLSHLPPSIRVQIDSETLW